jgi:hypothetical protein
MSKLRIFMFALLALQALPTWAQSQLCSNSIIGAPGLATGSLTDSNVSATAGTQWSELQHVLGVLSEANDINGYSCGLSNRCADDFIVPAGGWTLTGATSYVYQSNYLGAASPVATTNVRIWGPCPGATGPGDIGCNIAAGSTTLNVLASSLSTNLFRIGNTVVPVAYVPDVNRQIWRNIASFSTPITLVAGRYWYDYQVGTGLSNNFSPAVTIKNLRGLNHWNARQSLSGGVFANIADVGKPASAPDYPQDLPFELIGTGEVTEFCAPPRNIILQDGFEL